MWQAGTCTLLGGIFLKLQKPSRAASANGTSDGKKDNLGMTPVGRPARIHTRPVRSTTAPLSVDKMEEKKITVGTTHTSGPQRIGKGGDRSGGASTAASPVGSGLGGSGGGGGGGSGGGAGVGNRGSGDLTPTTSPSQSSSSSQHIQKSPRSAAKAVWEATRPNQRADRFSSKSRIGRADGRHMISKVCLCAPSF